MKSLRRSPGIPFAPAAAGVLFLLASCGPAPLAGRVVVSGSATLAPLAGRALEAWHGVQPRVEVRVEAIGSDAGLERLLRYGDADLALVSRPLTDTDQADAAVAGTRLVAWPLARDAVCLVVPGTDGSVAGLTSAQAALALTQAAQWSDLDPAFPRQTIHRFALGPASGTASVLAAGLLEGRQSALYEGTGAQVSEDDQILARAVAATPGALGFLGWTTYRSAGTTLRALALDGVQPSADTIRSQAYPLTRPLWLVASSEVLAHRTEVLDFVRWVFQHYETLTAEGDLVPLDPAERKEAMASLPNP